MAFDQATRNLLQRTVAACRNVLAGRWDHPEEGEFSQQLQQIYGINPDGTVAPLSAIAHLSDEEFEIARVLRQTLDHYAASLTAQGKTSPEARAESVSRILREQAFTVLNRLAALRLAEERGLVLECVRRGTQSEGFLLFQQSAGSALGSSYETYQAYLSLLFDELAYDLGSLFNRWDAQGLLFPRQPAMEAVLRELNGSGEANDGGGAVQPEQFAEIWSQDETIGWIYQYFNDPAERKKMRDESSAPRNSRELAVRNQFFTPRYVVEFLVDNTLGRLWYEMTRGETALRESCRYLVRRRTEIFLKAGESAPERAAGGETEDLSQEELLRQPVHIPHRPFKDPREIRLLDPACGSMHFGLYAFDLFAVIYDEAWEIVHGPDDTAKSAETFAPFVAFAATFPEKAAFLREVPRLIVERNIHGIDIDSRAAQIAGLSLWLRAQRAWHQAGVKPADRPRITRSNLVCAEPMPGEKELLREFVEQQFPAGERPAFAFLLEKIFDHMTLAGEAGSLLRIEEEIRTAIADATRLWKQGPRHEQASLFAEPGEKAGKGEMRLDLSGITDEQFWERAEQRIYDALEAYAGQAENGGGFQRRLFADDAAQGFAFIDLCRKRYDAVVMNPPFGEFIATTISYVEDRYPQTCIDFFASFVERGFQLLNSGLIGAITPRAFLFTKTLEAWRRERVLDAMRLLLDMGFGVLDGSIVETCAYVFSASAASIPTSIIDLRDAAPRYADALEESCGSNWIRRCLLINAPRFKAAPRARFVYYLGENFLNLLQRERRFDPHSGTAKNGLQTYGDERFLRLIWEVAPNELGRRRQWIPIAKGGDYETFFFPVHLAMNYASDGLECGEVNKQDNGQTAQTKRNSEFYYKPAATYPAKSTRGFSVRQLPAGSLFALKGPAVVPKNPESLLYILGWINSNLIRGLVTSQASTGEYLAGIVQNLPWIDPPSAAKRLIETNTLAVVRSKQKFYAHFETDCYFCAPSGSQLGGSLSALANDLAEGVLAANRSNADHVDSASSEISAVYEVPRTNPKEWGMDDDDHDIQISGDEWTEYAITQRILSYLFGCSVGRWDIRYATGEQPAPELPDPFAPLPVCPPGMLQGDDSLPLSPEAGRRLRTEGRYPLDVAWDGILVDDPEHPLDLERRVHAVLAMLWGDRADALEHEACALLGVPTLREWFRRPAGFFADHLKRYSKSRRQAPIYWPLSTASGSYTLWLYYHRLSNDTLFKCLQDFVEPKLRTVEDAITRFRVMKAADEGRAKERKQLEEAEALRTEMHALRDELAYWAPRWKPNLNDGVQITACPLWKLFRLPKWQTTLQTTWKELERGDYDWAHLALTLRPDEVRKKCETDRSIAIAHGLESICKVEAAKPKAKRSKKAAKQGVL
jgi:hypothetical protein